MKIFRTTRRIRSQRFYLTLMAVPCGTRLRSSLYSPAHPPPSPRFNPFSDVRLDGTDENGSEGKLAVKMSAC